MSGKTVPMGWVNLVQKNGPNMLWLEPLGMQSGRQKTEKKHFSGVSTACLNLCNGDSDCGGFWLESSYPNPVFTCKTVKKTCDLSVDNLVTASQGIIFLVKA